MTTHAVPIKWSAMDMSDNQPTIIINIPCVYNRENKRLTDKTCFIKTRTRLTNVNSLLQYLELRSSFLTLKVNKWQSTSNIWLWFYFHIKTAYTKHNTVFFWISLCCCTMTKANKWEQCLQVPFATTGLTPFCMLSHNLHWLVITEFSYLILSLLIITI